MKTMFSAVIHALLLVNAPAVDACSCGNYPTVCTPTKAPMRKAVHSPNVGA